MRYRLVITRLCLVVAGMFAIPALAPPAAAAAATPTSYPPLRIAVAAMFSPEETVSAYQELMDYIAGKLGRPVELKQRRTYQEVNDMLGTGKLDAAILCSGPYVHARRQYGIDLLAVPVVGGSPTYHSYVIVPSASQASSLLDLKGKRFAYTDPLSTSGRLYPVYAIMQAGRQPAAFFAKTFFTYSHDNSIEAVAEGLADGAAVDSLIYNYLKRTHPDLVARTRVVQQSPPLGAQPVGVPRSLDPAVKRSLRAVFLELEHDPAAQPILRMLGVDRFIPGNDRLYDSIREMLKVVEGAPVR
jgi:phosphonate transport system substrate-binding protein